MRDQPAVFERRAILGERPGRELRTPDLQTGFVDNQQFDAADAEIFDERLPPNAAAFLTPYELSHTFAGAGVRAPWPLTMMASPEAAASVVWRPF
jgi:hypothetical protein